jgi:homoserine kinase
MKLLWLRSTRYSIARSTASGSMGKITVQVPASTSNLGPGFDCLGVALRLYNFVTIVRGDKGSSLRIVRSSAALFQRIAHTFVSVLMRNSR